MFAIASFFKQHAFALLALALLVIGAIIGPIYQLPDYHHFADQAEVWGIPQGMDVLSNLGFLIVGSWGLLSQRQQSHPVLAWQCCFLSLIATALGSTYYHLQPDDTRLLWDRLPITLTCTTLISATFPKHRHAWLSLLIGAIYAVFSLVWWRQTGDLKYYLAVQLLILIWLPYSTYQSGNRQAYCWACFATLGYLIAKLCEWQDQAIFQYIGISGHTLKHIFASIATVGLVNISRRQPSGKVAARLPHTSKQIHVS